MNLRCNRDGQPDIGGGGSSGAHACIVHQSEPMVKPLFVMARAKGWLVRKFVKRDYESSTANLSIRGQFRFAYRLSPSDP